MHDLRTIFRSGAPPARRRAPSAAPSLHGLRHPALCIPHSAFGAALSLALAAACLTPLFAEEALRPGMRPNTRESAPASSTGTPPSGDQGQQTPEKASRRGDLRRVELGLRGEANPGSFRTIAGEDYVLGAYDELEISLLGPRPEKWEAPVSPQGTVTLPHAGSIPCAGLRLAAARETFTRALSRYYRNFELVVVVARLRGIEVTVTGHVVAPGPQSGAALARVWEAIERAGGIAESGSVRAVQVTTRGGARKVVDLYPFLFNGREESNPTLDSGDSVHLPVAERVVGLSGEVRRPGLYEFAAGESLAQLLAFAGGTTAEAALERAYVERVRPDQTKDILPVDLRGSAPGTAQDLRDGDVLVVPPLRTFLGKVHVSGQVREPGSYERKQNMRVSDLLLVAGGYRPEAALSRSYLHRLGAGEKTELQWLDLAAALRGDPKDNPLLQEGDQLFVPDVRRMSGVVSVRGEVRLAASAVPTPNEAGMAQRSGADVRTETSDELRFDLSEGMRVSDLVRLAGGTAATAALDRARLTRIRPDGMKEALAVDLRAAAAQPGGAADLTLRDGDFLLVPSIAVLQKTVRVAGEVVGTGIFQTSVGPDGGSVVVRRGLYELKEGDTVRDLIAAVGGITSNAAHRAARIERPGADGRLQRIPVDLYRLLTEQDESANVALRNGDEFIVPSRADLVYVVGAVNSPGAYEYREESNSVMNSIMRAGSFSYKANESDVQVLRADAGAKDRPIKPIKVDMRAVVRYGRVDKDPGVRPGDIVYVAPKIITLGDALSILANINALRFYLGR